MSTKTNNEALNEEAQIIHIEYQIKTNMFIREALALEAKKLYKIWLGSFSVDLAKFCSCAQSFDEIEDFFWNLEENFMCIVLQSIERVGS